MKAQMKYADKRGAPCVVIQGGDEKAKGEVQIKDLILGATLTVDQGPRRISERSRPRRSSPVPRRLEPCRGRARGGASCAAHKRPEPMAAESAKEFEALEAQAATLLDTFRAPATSRLRPPSSSRPTSSST